MEADHPRCAEWAQTALGKTRMVRKIPLHLMVHWCRYALDVELTTALVALALLLARLSQ